MVGIKPKGRVFCEWSSNFAYAVGLMATDGCISGDGRHITFVSKDIEQINNFVRCLKLEDIKIGINYSGTGAKVYRVQFGDILFYRFLLNIGVTPAKSLTLGSIEIPDNYFFDFLRGSFDGDGTFYSYWDPRWKSSFMYYSCFISASLKHIEWLRKKIRDYIKINGHLTKSRGKTGDYIYQLKYAKAESSVLLRKMYHSNNVTCLSRKKLKIEKALGIIGERIN